MLRMIKSNNFKTEFAFILSKKYNIPKITSDFSLEARSHNNNEFPVEITFISSTLQSAAVRRE